MTELESTKVYELAKELGIDSLSLIDKLKELKINVKNHMSGLLPDEVELARATLLNKKDPQSDLKSKKKITSKTIKKSASTDVEASTTKRETASPIIRRRTKTEPEEVTAPALQPKNIPTTTPQTEKVITTSSEEQQSQVVESEKSSTHQQSTSAHSQPVTPSPLKKNILKIVQAPTPSQPTPKRAQESLPIQAENKQKFKGTPHEKDGFRIIKMTKENIDQMAEEEAAKKRNPGRDLTSKNEEVHLADYRKKEMVFLPKKKKIPIGKEIKQTKITTPKVQKRVIEMNETIVIQDLANQLGVKANELIKKLLALGQAATINQSIDLDTATLLSQEYQYEVKNVSFKEEGYLEAVPDNPNDLLPRPPVVTIMGHVDHGKTSLLDAIRETNIAAKEAGGITQHIGAYTIEKGGKQITFIDTPGHEAFTQMRARGATVTDIVILVVAADDGVMPQTREAINHAKEANVPIIVAVNKMDKLGANIDKIKQSLAELSLLSEDWGGDTIFIPVSALKKTNLDKLLDAIQLHAEMLQLKANPKQKAIGTILESRLEKGKGPVVSVLVKKGSLNLSDFIISGQNYGKIKSISNHLGQSIKQVLPGHAGEVLGLNGVPTPGDPFHIVPNEAIAKKIVENRLQKLKASQSSSKSAKMSLEELFTKIQAGEVKELKIVLKGDVGGSVEAIRDSLTKISTDKVKVIIIHSGTGGITESDVLLASASNAVIFGFNVRPETKARSLAESEGIDIKCYSIIYELIDEVKKAMAGLLEKKKIEKFLGRAEVRQIFSIPKIGVIAGSTVVDGKIIRGANVRLLRDSKIVYEGKMNSLKRFKDDAKEVASGYECGIGLENYNDIKPGDLIEAYQIELVTQEII